MDKTRVFIDMLIFTIGIIVGAFIGVGIHFHKKEVTARNRIAILRYCAKPNIYLRRMYASNKTFLMYIHRKDYKAIAIGLKAENKALKRTILWNQVNLNH